MRWVESDEAISRVDDILASIGLEHGKRRTLAGSWKDGERQPRKPRTASAPAGSKLEVVRAAGWERYPWLLHGFSSRAGGASSVYGERSLNLGWTKDDDPRKVAANRQTFIRAVAGEQGVHLVALRQSHSGLIRVIGKPAPQKRDVWAARVQDVLDPSVTEFETAEGRAVLRGDGMMTNVPGLLLGVQVADCVPVLIADPKRKAVAAFHAGWRGTLKRIVERGIGTMRLRYGSRPEDLMAVIGPSIGACCYSVGEEVRFEFLSQFEYWQALFSEVYDSDPVKEKYPLLFLTARAPGHSNIGPQIHLDLWEANRRQLLDAGLKEKKITVIGECTACTRAKGGGLKYFSHRGEQGFAGRMMGVVGLAG